MTQNPLWTPTLAVFLAGALLSLVLPGPGIALAVAGALPWAVCVGVRCALRLEGRTFAIELPRPADPLTAEEIREMRRRVSV